MTLGQSFSRIWRLIFSSIISDEQNATDSGRIGPTVPGTGYTTWFNDPGSDKDPENWGNQDDPNNPKCSEDSAYPAAPDSEYGWEKLFSERLYKSFERNYGLNVRIGRFHNVFGPEGAWDDGKEKAPAAMCRKAILTEEGDSMEVWGDGKQTRSFLYIDECIEAVRRLMESDFTEPINIGSEEMISINDFAQMAIDISEKDVKIYNLYGKEFEDKYGHPVPLGVKGRNSDNKLFRKNLNWEVSQPLRVGMEKTFKWIKSQIEKG